MLLYYTHSLYNLLLKFVYNYWFLFIFPPAFRPSLPSASLYFDSSIFFLQFVDAPSVSVHLANEEPIPSRLIIRSEHDNVTLKCRANANPPVDTNSFGWYKNVREVFIYLFIFLFFFSFLMINLDFSLFSPWLVCVCVCFQGMRMSGEITETLHLTNLERQNIGEYSCSSRNELGENHSSTITLRVQCKFMMVKGLMANDLPNSIPIAVI